MITSSNVEPISTELRPEDGPRRSVYNNVADLVANPETPTPMIRLSKRFNNAEDSIFLSSSS